MPDIDLDGKLLSCHMMARATASHFPVRFTTGYFKGPGWAHSWCVTKENNIIDPYPWASLGGPLFIVTKDLSPWRQLYREVKQRRYRDYLTGDIFLGCAEKVTKVMGDTIQALALK